MFKNKYILIGIVLVLTASILFVFSRKNKSAVTIQPSGPEATTSRRPLAPIQSGSSYPIMTPSLSPTATIMPFNHPTIPHTSGFERGQIICAYQFPPTPGNFGDAKIEANWNNLVAGKNSTYKLDICLSINGNNSLVSTALDQNGSTVADTPWISMNTDYTFNLYDDHGGDIGTCGGIILSSCRINTVR